MRRTAILVLAAVALGVVVAVSLLAIAVAVGLAWTLERLVALPRRATSLRGD